MSKILFLFVLSSIFINVNSQYPTVLIHGIFSNKNEMTELRTHIKECLQTMDVYNIEIGNGEITSIFMDMNKQCEILSQNIEKLNISAQKINLIGISQGGLLARCYVERYSDEVKEVDNLITIATPHMGIYQRLFDTKFILNRIDTESSLLSISDYWKDPFDYLLYYTTNPFLVYINNVKEHKESLKYKENLSKLSNFVLFWSSIDSIIVPFESAKFEFYDILKAEKEQELVVQFLKESPIYDYDYIGLKELDETSRMHIYQIDCLHNEFKLSSCFNEVLNKKTDKTLLELIIGYLE